MPAMARRATLQTIADQVGVSRSTVSNAYNRPDQLAPELRARILAVADDLGYPGPDPAARRLRSGHSGVIGLLFTEALSYAFRDPAAVVFLRELAREAEAAGTALLLIPSPPGADAAGAVRDAVVDGLCVYSMADGQPSVQAALDRRLPIVIVEEPVVAGHAFIGIDDRGGTRAAAEHVLALGHRRIAVVVDRLIPDGRTGAVDAAREAAATFHIGRERLAGYREALEAAGIAWAGVPVQEQPNELDDGVTAGHALLVADTRPTAILAATDQLALGVLRAARELGLHVPGDLTIVGFDDVPEAATSDPPLTTVRQPLQEKGREAARLLAELQAGGPPRRVLLPVELVVRGTSAAPRA
jgi:DNA-binding LacI/PurR family transcriptional regulator